MISGRYREDGQRFLHAADRARREPLHTAVVALPVAFRRRAERGLMALEVVALVAVSSSSKRCRIS